MRAKEFSVLLEYDRTKTIQQFGAKILAAIRKDPSIPAGFRGHENFHGSERVTDEMLLDVAMSNIEKSDPTTNKEYTQAIAKLYSKGNVRLEDLESTFSDYLGKFIRLKKRRIIQSPYNDFMRYPDLQTFYNTVDQYQEPEEQLPTDVRGNATTVYQDASVRVVVPHDETAAKYYGRGTRWCTAATNYNRFEQYSRDGNLYIILPKDPKYEGEKYQLHFQSGQFMDETDEPVDNVGELLINRFPGLLQYFKQHEPGIENWIIFADNNVLAEIIEQIGNFAQEAVWENITDWEVNDDYWAQWQSEQARERGYVDENDDIDWDRVHEDNDLNDYTSYNDEARIYYRDATNLLKMSPDTLKEYAAEWARENDYGDGATITDIDRVMQFAFHKEFYTRGRGVEDGGVGEWIYKHLHIEPNKQTGKYTVKYISQPSSRR